MPRKIKNFTRRGIAFERSIVNSARAAGLIALRSAASKSPIDVVIIDEAMREIVLIQCKTGKYKEKGEYRDKEEANYTVKWKLLIKE